MIVTHHSPDLDAVTGVWLLKRFDHEKFATASVEFVNPGDKLTGPRQAELGVTDDQVTHVDTGLGEFDHHQQDRGKQFICATSLIYDYLCQIQPDKKNDQALVTISKIVTEIDHFGEVNWPDPSNERYSFMLHELLKGMEALALHNDDSMLNFAMTALDATYSSLTIDLKAKDLLKQLGQPFDIKAGKAMAILTSNDSVIKVAQKQGYCLVIKKDPDLGNMRIKALPDVDIDLHALSERIKSMDKIGTWYEHSGGKMLLNGSSKHRDQNATPLSLEQAVDLVKEIYG